MNLQVSVSHGLERERVLARLRAVAGERGATLAADPAGDPHAGTLEKKLGFIGRVRASFRIELTSIEFTVVEAPSLLGEARLRALLEDEIGRELSRLGGGGPA